jgi:hypothetical protein
LDLLLLPSQQFILGRCLKRIDLIPLHFSQRRTLDVRGLSELVGPFSFYDVIFGAVFLDRFQVLGLLGVAQEPTELVVEGRLRALLVHL